MKQIFENLGTILTREKAMRILGGQEGGEQWLCVFTYNNGPAANVYITANNGTAAQCTADARCWNDDACTDADCLDSGACV